MEVFFALLVLGCAFLLSFLASDSAGSKAIRDLKVPAPAAGDGLPSKALQKPSSGLQSDRERREELRQTIEQEPEVVTETLKQWLRE